MDEQIKAVAERLRGLRDCFDTTEEAKAEVARLIKVIKKQKTIRKKCLLFWNHQQEKKLMKYKD